MRGYGVRTVGGQVDDRVAVQVCMSRRMYVWLCVQGDVPDVIAEMLRDRYYSKVVGTVSEEMALRYAEAIRTSRRDG